jgi:Tol biopolymer transport system component
MFRTSLLVLFLAAGSAACDAPGSVLPNDPLTPNFASSPDGWNTAVSIDPGGLNNVNTTFLEGCPNESIDGRTLFFASDRANSLDIWMAHRQPDGSWGDPARLPTINTGAAEFCPTALPDGGLMFVSNRADGLNCGVGTADIYQTQFDAVLGWSEPEHLSCTVNSAANEFSPSYVPAGGGTLFFSSDRNGGKHQIYMSEQGADGAWESPAAVAALNYAGANTARPNVSADGRLIVFDSDRPTGLGAFDIWYAMRSTPFGEWSAPRNAGSEINSGAAETRASLARDGHRLYFGSNRGGYQGNFDIFVADRR